MSLVAARTWDKVIDFVFATEEAEKGLHLDRFWLYSEFVGDSAEKEEKVAFFWYMLHAYADLGETGEHSGQVNSMLGSASAYTVSFGDGLLGDWELMVNAPGYVTVPEDKKVKVKTWLHSKGLGDHATKLGL